MTEYQKRTCPSCHDNTDHRLKINSHPRAESLSLDETIPYWSGFFKKKIFFSYHECKSCGLLFCPYFYNENHLQDLYRNMEDNTAGISQDILAKTQRSYFDVLAKHSSLHGNYLEFGPDIGLLTETCMEKGKFSAYWLFEPNKKIWPVLQKKTENHSCHLFEDLASLESIPDKSISTVVMVHVLDHLYNPADTLNQLKKKLAPEAKLMFVTHNEKSLLAKLTGKKWPPFCLQHPQLFNPVSIKIFLEKLGFDVISCQKTYNYFPLTWLLKHFFWLFGIRNIKLPALKKMHVKLKLGNMITIAVGKYQKK